MTCASERRRLDDLATDPAVKPGDRVYVPCTFHAKPQGSKYPK